jgi:cell pole-organizing protein PopZ
MSDALSRREIEDVLTSIRRLVSHEAARPSQGKLVLTPALRVAAPADGAGMRAGAGYVEKRPANSQASSAGQGPGTGEHRLHEVNGVAQSRHDAGANASATARANGGARPGGSVARNEARIAPRDELEALVRQIVASTQEPPEPGGEVDPVPPTVAPPPTAVVDVAPADTQCAPDDALESHLAALEASIRQSEQAILGVSGPGVQPAATMSHTAQVNGDASARGHAMPPAGTGADPVPGSDVIDIDEAGLRAMVAEILREELQGALGERITRNIRKLVRTEVARALASGALADHRQE